MAVPELPQVPRVDASDVEKLIQTIKELGCAIITNFTTPDLVDRVNAETRPYLEADKPWKGKLFPPESRRCPRLIARSKTFREEMLMHPLVTKLTEYFLDETTTNYYSDEKYSYTTHPIINIATTLEVNPGSIAQRIHRDDQVHHNKHRDLSKTGYEMGADTSMGFLIPGIETTIENGATLVIPGSHLWSGERVPKLSECGYATMVPGEAVVFLGGTYHAGGANVTKDQKRGLHSMFFCRGILRSEENQYLCNSTEEVLSWSEEVQKKMGFGLSTPNLGFVDFVSPIQYLSNNYDHDHIPDAGLSDLVTRLNPPAVTA